MVDATTREEQIEKLKKIYGVKTEKEVLEKALKIALRAAKFAEQHGYEIKTSSTH